MTRYALRGQGQRFDPKDSSLGSPPPYSEQEPSEQEPSEQEPSEQAPEIDNTTPLLAEGIPQRQYVFVVPVISNESTDGLERANPTRGRRRSGRCRRFIVVIGILLLFWASLFVYGPLSVYVPRHPARPPLPTPTYTVAVIGAGPAGISTAYYLSALARRNGVRMNVTIFESAPVVGGRLALHGPESGQVFPYDDPTQDAVSAEDVAGSSLLWSNQLFRAESEMILFDKMKFEELPPQSVGYFEHEKIVSQATRPYQQTPWSSWLGLVWKYGRSVSRTAALIDKVDLSKLLVGLPAVSDVGDIVSLLGVAGSLLYNAPTFLREQGISDRYRDEVIDPQVRRAYGQGVRALHSLGLLMALAKEDKDARYIAGGRLLERLDGILSVIAGDHDDSSVIVETETAVTGVKHEWIDESKKHPTWLLQTKNASGQGRSYHGFDRVVVAAPGLERDLIQISDDDDNNHTNKTSDYKDNDAVDAAAAAAANYEGDDELAARYPFPDMVFYRPVYVSLVATKLPLQPTGPDGSPAPVLDQAMPVNLTEGSRYDGVLELAFVRKLVLHGHGHGDQDDGGSGSSGGSEPVEANLYRALADRPLNTHEVISALGGGLDDGVPPPGPFWQYNAKIDAAYPMLWPRMSFPSFELSDKGLWMTSAVESIGSSVDLSWLAGKVVAQKLIDHLKN